MKNYTAGGYKSPLFIAFLSIFALIVSLCVLGYSISKTPRVAYIKSEELLQKYKGMQDAKAKFEEKAKTWQSKQDTLKSEFETELKAYEQAIANMGASVRAQKEKDLRFKQEQFSKFSQNINQQAEQEDKKLTEGVLAQVNAFLKVYGEKHGYDILFGANGGTIVHGNDAFDITDEVLIELNRQYEGH